MKHSHTRAEQRVLLFSIFIVSLCGIIYELVLGSLASYLLGNPVAQYSITIGFFLSSMGLGSFLSRYVTKNLVRVFVVVEVILGIVGGLSVLILNYIYSLTPLYMLYHIVFLVLVGTLVGMEIPLLTRILREYGSLKSVISNVLSIDYIGGLAGSLLFPLILFPLVGRFSTCAITGIANIAVAGLVIARVGYEGKKKIDAVVPVVCMIALAVSLVFSGDISKFLQSRLYTDDIILTKRTKYQEIVLTRSGNDFRLFLDGSIQFSTTDEYRYHEMLVHPAVTMCENELLDVLVMGGGDGMAVREVLKHDRVASVTLAELDPEMIKLAKENASFRDANKRSLHDARVEIVAGDAYGYLAKSGRKFDVIIADFSDPHDETISKLYTREFYTLVKKSLSAGGIFVTQATSPLSAREAFWCIHNTMKSVFAVTVPYHTYVPSFGEWGFVIGSDKRILSAKNIRKESRRYYSADEFAVARHFQPDADFLETKLNTYDRPLLYQYYLHGWKNFEDN